MRRTATLFAILLAVAACGGTSSSDSTTTTLSESTTTTPPETPTTSTPPATTSTEGTTSSTAGLTGSTGPQLVLSSVVFGAAPMVVITNVGDEPGNLAGHFLCQRPSYDGLPDVEVPAGQSIAFSLGGDTFIPPPGAIVGEGVIGIGGVSNGGGEIGLYTSSDFGSASAIISYVEWGSAGHGRSDVAGEAGIWSGFVPTTDGTLSLSASELPATSSDMWVEG